MQSAPLTNWAQNHTVLLEGRGPFNSSLHFQRFGAGNSKDFGRISEDGRLILMEVPFREGYQEHSQNGGGPDEAFEPEADDPQNGVSAPAIQASS